ncbi:TetR family transcriptional regulator [Williamsia limnetica]|uniref:TetR family transcriptional regulator n=1 Tax=Williamsia limnetica TaxID=882452 RepID=A0A318RRP3_WILLI|nr:TetR/AcrR family transcriptional regulator [Williamsia limnetica]PYE19350.1 TetR family transcriptional regulator [Williamsia limnetica]
MGKSETNKTTRRTSRQREAGAAIRAETRRRILEAAIEVFTESGYAAATVTKIADRADVSVQSIYSSWGNKRGLLRGMMESQVIGTQPGSVNPQDMPAAMLANFDPATAGPRELLAHLSHQFRLLTERAASGFHTYAQAAAVDPEAASDWQNLMEIRRMAIRNLVGVVPADRLRPGLTHDSAADTAWVIASPQSHDLLVVRAGFSYDEFEDWIRTTLTSALLPDVPA